jgi:hypothetical protein
MAVPAGREYCPFDLLARDGQAGFDVIAVNVYSGKDSVRTPWFADGIHALQNLSGLPLVPDSGSLEGDQRERGEYYQSQLQQFYSFPKIIGVRWHRWADSYMPKTPDSGNLSQVNKGLVQCDDPDSGFHAGARWQPLDDYVADVNCNIMVLIKGRTGL